MAKVGGPSLPPVSPNRPPAEPTPVQQQQPPDAVRQQTQQPAAPSHSTQAAPPNVSASAQQVAQQFGSAFVSAGKLASQLVKGLAQTGFVPRRDDAEKVKDKATPQQKEGVEGQQQARRQEPVEAKGDQQQGQGGRQGSQDAAPQNALGAAFAALRKSRLFKSKKKEQKKAAGGVKGKLLEELQTDYDEEKREEHLVHRWIKGDEEETAYDQAGRASQFIGELERRNEPPAKIARHLAAELAGSRDPEFRKNFAQALQPHLEAMAARVPEAPSEERRTVAAVLSRAAHRSGQQGSKAFTTVLSRAGDAEAKELAALAEDSRAWLEGFDLALRRGANGAYRDALAAGATAEIKEVAMRLAADPVDPTPLLRELLKAAGRLSFEGARPIANAISEAIVWVGDAASGEQLLRALIAALREEPEGAAVPVHLLAALWQAGQAQVAEAGALELGKLLREARQSFLPSAQQLVQFRAEVAKRLAAAGGGTPTDEERERHDALIATADDAAGVAAALFTATAAVVLQKQPANTPGAMAVGTGAVSLVASADLLLSVGPGQALLRRALVAQELGDKTVLEGLVPAARVLASPGLVGVLQQAGLKSTDFGGNGRLFSSRVGPHLTQALGAVISARARKGDLPGAMSLLKSAVRGNAALLGVNLEGARFLSGMMEGILERPSPRSVEQAMPRLEKILRQHTAWDIPFQAKSLRPLMNTLAAPRDPVAGLGLAPKPAEAQRISELSLLRIEANQASLAKARAKESEAKPAPAPKPGARPAAGARPLSSSAPPADSEPGAKQPSGATGSRPGLGAASGSGERARSGTTEPGQRARVPDPTRR